MILLALNSAYLFPEAEFVGEAFWFPPVRQTGFLHPAALMNVDPIFPKCPRVMAVLSTQVTESHSSLIVATSHPVPANGATARPNSGNDRELGRRSKNL
jgi:hypothetical protein